MCNSVDFPEENAISGNLSKQSEDRPSCVRSSLWGTPDSWEGNQNDPSVTPTGPHRHREEGKTAIDKEESTACRRKKLLMENDGHLAGSSSQCAILALNVDQIVTYYYRSNYTGRIVFDE